MKSSLLYTVILGGAALAIYGYFRRSCLGVYGLLGLVGREPKPKRRFGEYGF